MTRSEKFDRKFGSPQMSNTMRMSAAGSLPAGRGAGRDAPESDENPIEVPPGMACAGCRADNPPFARTCVQCGQDLEIAILRCDGCGLELPSLARTCIQCGNSL